MQRPTAKDFDKGYIKSAYDAINKRDELIKALDRYIDHLEKKQVKKLNIDDVGKQRKLLIAFKNHWNTNNDIRAEEIEKEDVDLFLSNL